MLKSQAFGSSTRVASATLQRSLLAARSSNAGAGGLIPACWNNNNNNFQKQRSSKIIRTGRLRLVCPEIKAGLATTAVPTTTVTTKIIVKKITGEITSSTFINEKQAIEKLLKLEFASILMDPSKFPKQ